jgi:hypothetical protein
MVGCLLCIVLPSIPEGTERLHGHCTLRADDTTTVLAIRALPPLTAAQQ